MIVNDVLFFQDDVLFLIMLKLILGISGSVLKRVNTSTIIMIGMLLEVVGNELMWWRILDHI